MSLQDAQDALVMIQEAREEGNAADLAFSRPGVAGGYNPETGEIDPGTPALNFTGTAVILPASQGTVQAFDQRFVSGTLIESTLRALLIAALGMEHEPKPGDKVTFPDGATGTLIGCTPLNPDGANAIIYQATTQL